MSDSVTYTWGTVTPESGVTYECRLEPFNAWGPCSGSMSFTGIDHGTYTFSVRAIDAFGNRDETPATRALRVDRIFPDTELVTGPPALTTELPAVFSFRSLAADATAFECRLSGPTQSDWASCDSGTKAYAQLADGSYTFAVRAVDAAGNRDLEPATRTFELDRTGPAAPTVRTPADGSWSASATLRLTGATGANQTVEVRGDGVPVTTTADGAGAWGIDLPALAEGAHRLIVTTLDVAGNRSAEATVTVHIDTVAPDTTIDSGPDAPTRGTSAKFTFSGDAGFQCRLDQGAWTACVSPLALDAVPEGRHTLAVRAVDRAGNLDPSPAERAFTIDRTAPAPPVVTAPAADAWSTSGRVTLTGTAELGARVTVTDRFAVVGPEGAWSTQVELPDGDQTVTMTTVDAAGNVSAPTRHVVRVDTRAPDTTIGGSLTLGSDEPGAVFECRFDGERWRACAAAVDPAGLAPGRHVLQARAIDLAGNVDPTPAEVTFTVAGPAAQPSPSPTPTASATPVPRAEPAATSPAISTMSGTRKLDGKRRTALATVFCQPGVACTVSIPKTVAVTIAGKRYTARVLAPATVAAGRRANVQVELTEPAAKRLKGRSARVTVKVSARAGSSARTTLTVTAKVSA